MPLYGYVHVSSLGQDLTLQEQTLRAVGCEVSETTGAAMRPQVASWQPSFYRQDGSVSAHSRMELS